MKTWVRLYTNILRDPKFLRLSKEQIGVWGALLALAGEIDDRDDMGITGFVGTRVDAAFMIHCEEDIFDAAAYALTLANLIVVKERGLFMVGYAETQKGGEGRPMSKVAAWRSAVFERDGFKCQRCGVRGVKLNAHHIAPWCLDSKKRFAVSNGMTLCVGCHRTMHKPGWLMKARRSG